MNRTNGKNNLKHEADEIEQESLPNKHHLKIKRKNTEKHNS